MWTISAHACHMRDDNNKSSFRWQVTQATPNWFANTTRRSTETVFFANVSSFTIRGRNWLHSFPKDGLESRKLAINSKSSICNMSLSHQSVDRFLPTRLGFLLYSLKATSSFWILFHSTVFTRKEDFSKEKKHLLRILFLLKMTARFCFWLYQK